MCLLLLKSHTIEITLRPYGQGIRGRVVSWKETNPSTALDIHELSKSLKTKALCSSYSKQWDIAIEISLTYLRGLEVAELTEEDMPKV